MQICGSHAHTYTHTRTRLRGCRGACIHRHFQPPGKPASVARISIRHFLLKAMAASCTIAYNIYIWYPIYILYLNIHIYHLTCVYYIYIICVCIRNYTEQCMGSCVMWVRGVTPSFILFVMHYIIVTLDHPWDAISHRLQPSFDFCYKDGDI